MAEEFSGVFRLMEAVEHHAGERPADVSFEAITEQGRESMPWSRLVADARGLSQDLAALGLEPDDRVAILMENHPRWAVAFLAVQSAGGVVVPLDTAATEASLAHIVAHSEARFLIASQKFWRQAQAIHSLTPSLARVLSPEDSHTAAFAALPLRKRTLDDGLAILYTGGTTGRPKGVLLTQRGLGRSISDMLDVFPLTSADTVLCVLPLFHVMPLLANLLAPALTGCRVVFLNQLDPEILRRTFETERVTAFLCVPQFYYQIQRRILEEVHRQPAARQRAFHALLKVSGLLRRGFGVRAGRLFFRPVHARFGKSLRAFGVGGAYFNPKATAFFEDLGFSMFQAYGLTECSGLATVTTLARNGGRYCGRPVEHCEVRIGDPDANGTGEILLRGENVMKGYWRDPEATAAALRDGWLHTGDLGSIDSDGSLRVTGRAKDVVVLSSGKNVFPEELEEYFAGACDAIQEICFVGIEGADGAVLHCTVFPAPVASANHVRAQLAAAAAGLPSYKRPGSIQIVPEPLPRTTTRKLQRFRVRELAVSATQAAPAETRPQQSDDPLEHKIVHLLRRIRPAAASILPATHLEFDLRLDSLERVELLFNVESTFGIRISPHRAAAVSSVSDLIREVRELSGGPASETTWTNWTELIRAPLTPSEEKFADHYLRARPFLERWWYGTGRVLAMALRCGMKLRRQQAAEFPRPPFIICPNHASYLDTPAAACLLPYDIFRRVFLLGLSSYFRTPFWRWVAGICRIVPLDKEQHLMSGMRMGKAGLGKGLVLWVYPEGTRSTDGRVQELRKGTALLACALRIPVVPMGIAGTFKAWPRGQMLPRTAKIGVATGEPLTVFENESPEAFSQRLRAAIVQQLSIAESLHA